MKHSSLPFDEAIAKDDGAVEYLKSTAKVWSVEKQDVEVPQWHKYNLIPNSKSGVDTYAEQIWIIDSLVYDAAFGQYSEMEKLYEGTLYNLYRLITLRKAAEFNS